MFEMKKKWQLKGCQDCQYDDTQHKGIWLKGIKTKTGHSA
jgi:hypothetical protein